MFGLRGLTSPRVWGALQRGRLQLSPWRIGPTRLLVTGPSELVLAFVFFFRVFLKGFQLLPLLLLVLLLSAEKLKDVTAEGESQSFSIPSIEQIQTE